MERRREALRACLAERVQEYRSGPGLVIIVVGAADTVDADRERDLGRRLRATLRETFADPGMVFAVAPDRCVVVARRHPGLALTVTTLAQVLAGDPLAVEADLRIWCEQPPASVGAVDAFLDDLVTKPAAGHRQGVLPAPADLIGVAEPVPEPARERAGGRAATILAAAAAIAVLVAGAGVSGLRETAAPRVALGSAQRSAADGLTHTTGVHGARGAGSLAANEDDVAALGFEYSDSLDDDHDGSVRLAPVQRERTAEDGGLSGADGAPGGPSAAAEAPREVVLVVLGVDLSVALEMIPADVQPIAVFLGVPGLDDLPENEIMIVLEGATPGDLCLLLDARDDATVVGDTPACGSSDPAATMGEPQGDVTLD